MSHPTSKCIRLDRTLSFAHITRKSQLPCWTASKLSLPNAAINIDDIATQTLQYLAVFKEHLSAIRGHPQWLGTCEHLLKKREAPHPQQLTDYAEQQKLWMKMEDLIQRHATMVDEWVLYLLIITYQYWHEILDILPYVALRILSYFCRRTLLAAYQSTSAMRLSTGWI